MLHTIRSSILRQLTAWLSMPYYWLRYGSPLKPDESVVLFPQSAAQNPDHSWTLPLHAWVVELEQGTLSRRLGQRATLALFDLLDVAEQRCITDTFRQRLNWFMADREINKKLKLLVDEHTFTSPRSAANGHIKFSAHYTGNARPGTVLEYRPQARQHSTGRIQLVPSQGISVISDIDDTIKISHVTDKKRLLEGFFFDDYKPTPGMPAWYRTLAAAGCCFHYVSASPWQLYPSLKPLLDEQFPFGSVSQRHFYPGDKSFIEFFLSSREYKIEVVSDLLTRFPERKFVLIGDSGEKDPEVYCSVAAQFADRILAILIRKVPDSSYPGLDRAAAATRQNDQRWQQLKNTLPEPIQFRVFDDPSELADITNNLINTATAITAAPQR